MSFDDIMYEKDLKQTQRFTAEQRANICFVEADKSEKTIIMLREVYNDKMENLSANQSRYSEVHERTYRNKPVTLVNFISNKINAFVTRLEKNGRINRF